MLDELYLRGITRRPTSETSDSYVYSIPAIRNLQTLTFHSPVTFFVGENGTGKSTLLEAIAVGCGFNAEGGTQNFQFSTQSTHSDLHRALQFIRGYQRPKDGFFLRAESFYNVASEIDRLDRETVGLPPLRSSYGGKSLHEQSHGESFLALMLNRFGGHGLYLLDEPEAALSPSRQMSLLALMHTLVKQHSQFLIATHSPILMAYPHADIFLFDDGRITKTAYRDTEHYQITKRFLDNPERMLRYLMGQDES